MRGKFSWPMLLQDNPSLWIFTKSQHRVVLQQLNTLYISALLSGYPHMPLSSQPVNSVQYLNIFYTSISGPKTACDWQQIWAVIMLHALDLFTTSHSVKNYHLQIMLPYHLAHQFPLQHTIKWWKNWLLSTCKLYELQYFTYTSKCQTTCSLYN